MEYAQGKELTEFMESQKNKIKTNIKIRVTPEQSRKVQEVCFDNGIEWKINSKKIRHLDNPYLTIEGKNIFCGWDLECFNMPSFLEEIDADLFIRTNGTCEEDKYKMFDTMIQKPYDVVILEQKLKKKNEILKKARIKRKNQREELHKLNLKLQKCISLEEHKEITNDAYLRNSQLEDNFRELRKLVNLNKSDLDLAMTTVQQQNKKIEKLKAVIEYLESKVK